MKRREFIRNIALAGFAMPLLISCDGHNAKKDQVDATDADNNFSINEITIQELQQQMKEGKLTSRSITEMYLKRIESIDKSGPLLNSVIEINPDAISIAEALDAERKEGKVRGPMHGIPVLIKDNIDTADKMMTTAGSIALEGHHAAKDAFLVKKLREGGAVILGKANLSEWANFRSTRSSSGWSSRGGQTKNPYVLDRNPCGSSSGSGTAVSANLCAAAIGTETNGSIACPSSINGIVGLKPTVGLVSRSGIIPISHTQDTAGPMTRTVNDTAILLTVIAGEDADDNLVTMRPTKTHLDYTQFLQLDGLSGKRIGVEKSYLKVHEGVDALLQEALETMRSKGATVVEVELRDKIKIAGAEYEVLQYEFRNGLNRYFERSQTKIKSLQELIEFNKQNEARAMPFFKQEILESSEKKKGLDSKEYQEALEKVLSTRKTIDEMLKSQKLDAVAGPTNGPSWCTDLINGDFFTGYGMYSPAAMAGYPHISVPMGMVSGLPVGLTFLSGAFREDLLFNIAYAYEQASRKRTGPEFLSTLNLTK